MSIGQKHDEGSSTKSEVKATHSNSTTEEKSQIIKDQSKEIKELKEDLEKIELRNKIDKAKAKDMRGGKIFITASVIAAFISVSFFFFFYIYSDVKAEFNVAAVLSLIAGSFAAFLIMAITGTIKEFSIKSPIFEMTSKIQEKIKEVQDDVETSKNEVNEKLSTLNQNLQAVNNSIRTISKSSSESGAFNTSDQKQALELSVYLGEIISNKQKELGISSRDPAANAPQQITDEIIKLNEIREKLEKIVTPDPQNNLNIDAVLDEASLLTIGGKFEEAVPKYRQVLNVDPENLRALTGIGLVFRKLGNYRQAIIYFDKVMSIDPKPNVAALVSKGTSLSRMGKKDEGRSCYQEAIEIDVESNDPDSLVDKGIALYYLGKYEDAIHEFDKVIALNPNNLRALDNKGIALYYLGKYEDAIHEFDKVIALNPNYVNAMYNKSCNLYAQGKINESLELLEQTVKLSTVYKNIAKRDIEAFRKLKDEERKRFEKIVS